MSRTSTDFVRNRQRCAFEELATVEPADFAGGALLATIDTG